MRHDATPPTVADALAALSARVDSLERRGGPQTQTHLVTYTATAFPSPIWEPPAAVRYTKITAAASAAVAADTTFEVRRNGTAIAAVTIASGDTGAVAVIDPVVVDVGDQIVTVRTAGTDDATVQLVGTSQHPITPVLGGGGGLPKAWCGSGVVEGGSSPSGDTITGPDTSAGTADHFLVLVAITATNATGGTATPDLGGYIIRDSTALSGKPWQLPNQAMANAERIVCTVPCVIDSGDQIDFQISDSNTSGVDLTVGITVVEVDSITGACCIPAT